MPACRYGALFSSTRIPLKGKDRIVTQSVDQTFVIVQRGSAFYKVHIMDPKTCVPARRGWVAALLTSHPVSWSRASIDAAGRSLRRRSRHSCVRCSPTSQATSASPTLDMAPVTSATALTRRFPCCPRVVPSYPVGVLSAIDRDWAAELRPELVAMNKEAMHDVDSALFCVTLDDEAPTDDAAVRLAPPSLLHPRPRALGHACEGSL